MGLRKGQGVTLDGYMARSHLNGQRGTLEHRDPATGRFSVKLSETPWQTVKAADHQCQPAEAGEDDGQFAPSGLIEGRTPRLEGDQSGMHSFHPAVASTSPAIPRQDKTQLRLLEARAKRGHIRVKDELRTAVRMEVTRDKTVQDVHRLRNAGLAFFREGDAERGPRSHADPVPKPRRAPEGRVVLLASSELKSLFEASEDRCFARQMSQPRLPHCIDPPTPGDSDEEDCELCHLEQEKARKRAEEERHIEEHGEDECEVCLRNRERAEQEAREREERRRSFLERTDQSADRQPQPEQSTETSQESSASLGRSQGRRKARDDYDDFEADSGSFPGSQNSQSLPPMQQNKHLWASEQHCRVSRDDDYEAFEDDPTWVPGRQPPLLEEAGESTPPAASSQASGTGAAAAAAGGAPSCGRGAEGSAPVPRRQSLLAHADSILEDQSERELLKEHLLSALSPGAASPAPGAVAGAPAAEAAAGAQAQSGLPADEYGEDAFEGES